MALESYCAACTYLGEKADYSGKYYCSKRGDVYASDPKCYNFCEAYSRSTSARENMFSNSKSHQGGGCYLTTIMCNILNLPDNNYYLQTLRTFRDSVLKQNVKYFSLLYTYDVIGPQIANKLSEDKNKYEIASTLFKTYIIKVIAAIEKNEIDKAVNIYIAMTEYLAENYNISTNIIIPELETINIAELGHGRSRKRATNPQ